MNLNNLLEICIYGDNIERFLNLCIFHNIKLYNIRIAEECKCFVDIDVKDFFSLKKIKKKSKVKIKINHKKGLIFGLKKHTNRKIALIMPFLCLFLLWGSSQLLWGVRMEGNLAITDDLLEEFLKEQGIYYGMPLKKIPIGELKTNLRAKYDEITWVSIYLKGAYLQVSLKERDTTNYDTTSNTVTKNLTASTGGTVESVLIRQGTAMVKPGDEVEKGDILIEGKVEIPAEDGTIKEIRLCKAEGDVCLVYHYPIEEIITLEQVEKKYTGKTYQRYLITYKDKMWEIPFFQVPFVKYDCVTVPVNLKLFQIFSVPIRLYRVTYQDYVQVKQKMVPETAAKLLEEKLNKIIASLEEKGVQIIEKDVKIDTSGVSWVIGGQFLVNGPVGKLSPTEIVAFDGSEQPYSPMIDTVNENSGETNRE